MPRRLLGRFPHPPCRTAGFAVWHSVDLHAATASPRVRRVSKAPRPCTRMNAHWWCLALVLCSSAADSGPFVAEADAAYRVVLTQQGAESEAWVVVKRGEAGGPSSQSLRFPSHFLPRRVGEVIEEVADRWCALQGIGGGQEGPTETDCTSAISQSIRERLTTQAGSEQTARRTGTPAPIWRCVTSFVG